VCNADKTGGNGCDILICVLIDGNLERFYKIAAFLCRRQSNYYHVSCVDTAVMSSEQI